MGDYLQLRGHGFKPLEPYTRLNVTYYIEENKIMVAKFW